jgi:hypothetical protein
MEPQESLYRKDEYLRTNTSNLISRAAVINGTSNVRVKGKVGASTNNLSQGITVGSHL